jgi:tetratricopeptide (TPR) repeat protein
LSEGPVSPEAAAVFNNLGTLYYDQGRMKEAIPCFERSLELQPEDPVTLSNLDCLRVMEVGAARERVRPGPHDL